MAQHATAADCWCILHGKVFDLTAYLDYHPGGADILLPYAGTDVSSPFGISSTSSCPCVSSPAALCR